MTRADLILHWYDTLKLNTPLPANIEALNPYTNMSGSTREALEKFYRLYYNDAKPRGLILGINPGRLGAGLTGIPFTDTPALDSIGIDIPDVQTTETSADFVWRVVRAAGGPNAFFGKWFIGAVSPLGFVRKNDKGNWVNYNYYDDKEVFEMLKPFIVEQMHKQIEVAGNPKSAVLFGTGQNAKAFESLNGEHGFFENFTALEHPRFIMQYRRKRLDEFIEKFLNTLL